MSPSQWRSLLVLACAVCLGGCELIVRFDRDRITDAAVRPEGQVVD